MEEARPNLKNLPAEITHNIIRFAAGDLPNTAHNLALISRPWLAPTQSVMYSKVTIKTLVQLRYFYTTMQQSPHLGLIVRTLIIEIDTRPLFEINPEVPYLIEILLSNFLINLEEYNLQGRYYQSYAPLLEALQQSPLQNLRRLSAPVQYLDENELDNYATCALLLKDQIDTVGITEGTRIDLETTQKSVHANRIYNRLNEFIQLTSLNIIKISDEDIEVLENIFDNCQTLRKLSFEFIPLANLDNIVIQNNRAPTIRRIFENLIPATHLNFLDCAIMVQPNYNIIRYIMQKFSHLIHLKLHMKPRSPAILDHRILFQLLGYFRRIVDLDVIDLRVDLNTFSDTINEYWRVNEDQGKVDMKIAFAGDIVNPNTRLLNITNSSSFDPKFTLQYPSANPNNNYLDFIQRNGTFFRFFTFDYMTLNQARKFELPLNFFGHLLNNSEQLEGIQINSCTFPQSPVVADNVNREHALNRLYFNICRIHGTDLQSASLYLQEVGELYVRACFQSPSTRRSINPRISMTYTRIVRLVVEDVYFPQILYIKLYASDNQEYHYYTLNNQNLLESTEQEYTERGSNIDRMEILCREVPALKFIRGYNGTFLDVAH